MGIIFVSLGFLLVPLFFPLNIVAGIIAFFAGIFGLIIIRELPVVAIVSIIIAAICGFVAYNCGPIIGIDLITTLLS